VFLTYKQDRLADFVTLWLKLKLPQIVHRVVVLWPLFNA